MSKDLKEGREGISPGKIPGERGFLAEERACEKISIEARVY